MPVRQRSEEQRVDHAEDGRVGADPERERQDDDRGEGRCLSKRTNRVPEIEERRVDHGPRALLPYLFFHRFDAIERYARRAPCILGRHAVPAVPVFECRCGGGELLVEFPLDCRLANEGAPTRGQS